MEDLLKNVILPNEDFEIAHQWSGISGVRNNKSPVVTQWSENVLCRVRLSGVEIAIESLIRTELADLTA